jgi:hypothetical protein
MAADVQVNISGTAVIKALNTPGGAVREWVDDVAGDITAMARNLSPVNNPLNALHRGGDVGTYKASWSWNRRGSRGHTVAGRVENSANHATIVEFGRAASTKMQIFSWTEWDGGVYRIGGPSRRKLKEAAILTKRAQAYNERARVYNARIDRLPERKGNRTHERDGMFVLTDSTRQVLAAQGISF